MAEKMDLQMVVMLDYLEIMKVVPMVVGTVDSRVEKMDVMMWGTE